MRQWRLTQGTTNPWAWFHKFSQFRLNQISANSIDLNSLSHPIGQSFVITWWRWKMFGLTSLSASESIKSAILLVPGVACTNQLANTNWLVEWFGWCVKQRCLCLSISQFTGTCTSKMRKNIGVCVRNCLSNISSATNSHYVCLHTSSLILHTNDKLSTSLPQYAEWEQWRRHTRGYFH